LARVDRRAGGLSLQIERLVVGLGRAASPRRLEIRHRFLPDRSLVIAAPSALFSGTPDAIKQYCRDPENDAGNYLRQSHIDNRVSELKCYIGGAQRHKETKNDERGVAIGHHDHHDRTIGHAAMQAAIIVITATKILIITPRLAALSFF
jgi:hypothetical protein